MSTEDRLAKLEAAAAVAGWPGFAAATPTPEGNRIAYGVARSGTPMKWSEQAGQDNANVFQGYTEYPFVPPLDGAYQLDLSGRDPAFALADVTLDGPGVKWDQRPAFGALNAWTPALKAGVTYTLKINPITPADGAGAARFVAGAIQK